MGGVGFWRLNQSRTSFSNLTMGGVDFRVLLLFSASRTALTRPPPPPPLGLNNHPSLKSLFCSKLKKVVVTGFLDSNRKQKKWNYIGFEFLIFCCSKMLAPIRESKMLDTAFPQYRALRVNENGQLTVCQKSIFKGSLNSLVNCLGGIGKAYL